MEERAPLEEPKKRLHRVSTQHDPSLSVADLRRMHEKEDDEKREQKAVKRGVRATDEVDGTCTLLL